MGNAFVFDCDACSHRCDGVSKKTYLFENDADYSERKEQALIAKINRVGGFCAVKCELKGYPDIEVTHLASGRVFYIEVKAQRRTFMAVQRKLPDADLTPSETVACNLSDLVRYIGIHKETAKPIFVVWCLENRPCIVEEGATRYFYADIAELEKILLHYGDKRRFRREEGEGDVVNGVHKGVVVNYHFSLNELTDLHLLKLLESGLAQALNE